MLGSACPEWTGAEVNLLCDLWAQGLSLNAISARLPGRSRNAVSSKVARLDLPARPSPIGSIAAGFAERGMRAGAALIAAEAARDDLQAARLERQYRESNETYAREIARAAK